MAATLKKSKSGNGFVSWKINGIKVNSSVRCNTSNYKQCDSRKVSWVVMHYTGNEEDTAKANCSYFHNRQNLNASAHFFVDEENICQSVAMHDIALAVGDGHGAYGISNSDSVSIEMCCSGNYKVSAATQKNAAALAARLCKALGITYAQIPKYVVRHYDASRKLCPKQMCGSVSKNLKWKAFLKKVKAEYKKLDAS